MGVALNANPSVKWYFNHKCPEYVAVVDKITADAPQVMDAVTAAVMYTVIASKFGKDDIHPRQLHMTKCVNCSVTPIISICYIMPIQSK